MPVLVISKFDQISIENKLLYLRHKFPHTKSMEKKIMAQGQVTLK